jgi:PPOX class probable F420-dependent enzyme
MTIADARYIRFTNFRRTGEPVSTPVWIAPFGDEVVFSSHPQAGKIKRLRNDSKVEIAECSVRGAVKPGTDVFEGAARLLPDDEHAKANKAMQDKYGIQWKVMGVGQAIRKLVGRDPGHAYIAIAVGEKVRSEPATAE